jgi:hypothetical protein
MRKFRLWLILLISLVLVCPALAQMGPGRGGRGMGPRLYNPQTVTTVKGTVAKLEEMSMGRRGMVVRNVILKTAKGNFLVHLGPTWYLEQQKFPLKAGDTLEVTGSQVILNNQPAIIAKDAVANGKTLKLRDASGIPVWRGRGAGSQGGQNR